MNIYKKIRCQNKMTIEDLAKEMGLPVQIITLYERCTNPVPTLHFKERFKKIFNVTEEELRGETE